MKKLFILLSTFYIVLVANGQSFQINGINYYFTSYSPNSVEVRQGNYFDDIVIPSTISYQGISYDVSSIGVNAFFNCVNLTSVTIPSSVTKIADFAFYNCVALTDVNISSSLTSIGSGAFNNCTALTSISIPTSVTSIGSSAFKNTAWLSNQPHGMVYIGKIAYAYNGAIPANTNITLDDGTTSIASYAFEDQSGLISITIPSSVTSIGVGAFMNCTGLSFISIPSSVTSIGGSAFSGCTELASLTVPTSVSSIGSYAFYNTAWLTNQPNGMVYIGKVAYGFKGTMPPNTNITLIDGTIGIAENAFSGCTGLESISIPSSVTSIGSCAFQICSGLKSITIPSSVTSIQKNTFTGCSGLTSITLPNTLITIDDFAFSYCTNLEGTISIPSSVIKISGSTFTSCKKITGFNVDNNNSRYTSVNGVIYSLNQDTLMLYPPGRTGSALIPNSVKVIADRAFFFCEDLTGQLDIPNSVTHIGEYAFTNCSNITGDLIIPESVIYVGPGAFNSCIGLTGKLIIPSSVKFIGNGAFRVLTNISSVYSQNSTPVDLSVVQGVFYNINKDCNLYVPKGSKSIYESANQWQDFTNIIEESVVTWINLKSANDMGLVVIDKEIKCFNIPIGTEIHLINIEGRIMNKIIGIEQSSSMSVPKSGVYIVKIGDKYCKLLIP